MQQLSSLPMRKTKQKICKQNNLLPILNYRDQIIEQIAKERVLIISGKTGCGKSTQLPQFILDSDPNSKIAICQPRRIAASSLATRVSEERNSGLGKQVGYHVSMDMQCTEQTRVTFMTYGIMIQKLLFNQKIEYKYIILDEVHERSLEMDFLFIALRKILDQPDKTHIKLIIMSATINAQQFSLYFATNSQTLKFIKPEIVIKEETKVRTGRGTRNNNTQLITVTKNYQKNALKPAKSIILDVSTPYQIQEIFLSDLATDYLPNYGSDQDTRISDKTMEIAVNIIFNKRNEISGDILVFVPGIYQIKKLKLMIKQKLMIESDDEFIIQVHSAYSEDLGKRLFDEKIKNKLIISTNMGESSITLPFCKIVIDFCLTRKNYSNKITGFNRFETRLASKSSLSQRAGRVGRVSDGIVYRLISKDDLSMLSEFDIPEIKCVSLEMIILRGKKIDLMYKSDIFQDPYQLLLNAIQPPQLKDIQFAIKSLIDEDALLHLESSNQQNKGLKYEGKRLKITKIGQFMVSMPCDLKVSKMLLLAIKIGIAGKIADIASLLIVQKDFFMHEQKRQNIQQFLHSLVGYDEGYSNDFLLRQKLFDHWRSLYFLDYKEDYQKKWKINPKKNNNLGENIFLDEEQFQGNKIIEDFMKETWSNKEKNWCSMRGVYPSLMRDLLRVSENIRAKLTTLGVTFEKDTKNVSNQLILMCLASAFQITESQVKYNFVKKYKHHPNGATDTIVIKIRDKPITLKDIEAYVSPEEIPEIQFINGSIQITGNALVLKKFLLPHTYTKANTQVTSKLYYLLSREKPQYGYESRVEHKNMAVTVGNESINRICIRQSSQKMFLLTNTIQQSKGKNFIKASALINQMLLIASLMIGKKNVSLRPHVFWQFYDMVDIDGKRRSLPFILTEKQIGTIVELRSMFRRQKQNEIGQECQKMIKQQCNKLFGLLDQLRYRPSQEEWEQIYQKEPQNNKYYKKECQFYNIDSLPSLEKYDLNYYERYSQWKRQYQQDLYHKFKKIFITQPKIICNKCYPNHITQIQDFSKFCFKNNLLSYNEYSCCLIQQKKTKNLLCCKKHYIGEIFDEDYVRLVQQNIKIYVPYNKIMQFKTKNADNLINQIQRQLKIGIRDLEQHKYKIRDFQCLICMKIDENDQIKPFLLQKDQLGNKFYQKIKDHIYSKDHINRNQLFSQNY